MRLISASTATLVALSCACGSTPTLATPEDATLDGDGDAIGAIGSDAGDASSATPDAGRDASTDAALTDAAPSSPAATFSAKLGAGHAGHFAIGLGNDGTNGGDDPAYHLGATLDLHYHYLVGTHDAGGWTTWNSAPDYATLRIQQSQSHGVVPMFVYYAMATNGDGNLAGNIGNGAFLKSMFEDFEQLLADIAATKGPVVVLIEPDFWGYTEQAALTAGGASKVAVQLSAAAVPECAGLTDDLVGLGHCYVKLSRARASNALIGFHASGWGSAKDVDSNVDPSLDVGAEAAKTVAYFATIGANQADFVSTDVSDRDVGCYEVGADPNCQGKTALKLYWDESNSTLPNFHQELAFVTALTSGLHLPMIWWQLPLGVPSTTPGGSAGHYRDDRVHYMFGHIGEYVAAGGVALAFGTGAANQTDVTTDGSQFSTAVQAYFASPVALP